MEWSPNRKSPFTMATDFQVTALSSHQLKKASDTLTAAFFHYPMFTFYFPDPQRRARYLSWVSEECTKLRFSLMMASLLVTDSLERQGIVA